MPHKYRNLPLPDRDDPSSDNNTALGFRRCEYNYSGCSRIMILIGLFLLSIINLLHHLFYVFPECLVLVDTLINQFLIE